VLLLVLAGLGVLVLEDEVDLFSMSMCGKLSCFSTDLIGSATFIGAKHDDIGRSVGELFRVERLVFLEKFHVCTTAFKTILPRVSRSRTRNGAATHFEA
jgi:hypothetical protein